MEKQKSSFNREEIGLLIFIVIGFFLISFEDNPFLNFDINIEKKISNFGFLFTTVGLLLLLYIIEKKKSD